MSNRAHTIVHCLAESAVALAAILAPAVYATERPVTDVYDFKMIVEVPRVYDNMESLGYRKYQRQLITGRMTVTYDTSGESRPVVSFGKLVNKTHKVNGENVEYDVTIQNSVTPRVNVIGSNKTGLFKTPSVEFAIQAWPSYSKGAAPDEDNSLNIVLSGKGVTTMNGSETVIRSLSGSVAGALGCSCTEYGHVSPTRVMGVFGPSASVDDVAAVYGTWKATRVKNESRK